MKYIEVTETNIAPTNTAAPGIYIFSGMLYICSGNGNFPFSAMLGQIALKELQSNPIGGGMSEGFILRLLAIGNKPDCVHDFTIKT